MLYVLQDAFVSCLFALKNIRLLLSIIGLTVTLKKGGFANICMAVFKGEKSADILALVRIF